jgi:urease accessory protein
MGEHPMEIHERLGLECDGSAEVLLLDHEQRERGRLRTRSVDGEEVRIFLERGAPLRLGEYLRSDCGRLLRVEGAAEPVLTADCPDWRTFSRACYHLGNRHVKIQIGDCWLRITQDHVLEEMLLTLGLSVRRERAVFVPEPGAYGNAHSHSHAHH